MKRADAALDLIFRQARTHNVWRDVPVTDDQLRELYDLLEWVVVEEACELL